MLFVCYNIPYLSINNSEKWLVTRILPTQLKKLLKLHRKKSNNQPMVRFSHNGSEIITWMGHSQLQNQKHKIQSNIFKTTTPYLNFKLQIIRLAQGRWCCIPTHQNSYFYSCTYEKTYLAVHIIIYQKRMFFCQFVLT